MASHLGTSAREMGRIGRYRLIKRLAVGGMADLYLAQQHGPRGYERTVVVKTIRADLVDDEDLVQMLLEEARIASCLRHENIVELFEVGEDAGSHFLAMEFVFGRDLGEIRDRCAELGEPVPFEHVTTILADVLSALHYAHHDAMFEGRALEVVHRDVSPQNVLLGFDGTVRLLDFGLAKATAQISKTRAGVLKGKYAYMSPEQVEFRGVDQRSDLFSAGTLLWELATERRLFHRASDYETVEAVLGCSVPFPRRVRHAVPWNMAWVAYRALRKNPRWRYGTAKDMRAALLRGDARTRAVARDALAEWLAELFRHRLDLRRSALERAHGQPALHRQILDAGFELVEETTDPGFRDPGRSPRKASDSRGPAPSAGALGPLLATWRWFVLVCVSLVFLGLAIGIHIGSSRPPSRAEAYGYLSVHADVAGVRVVVGNRGLGTAPVLRIPVIPGRHRIRGMLGEQTRTVEVSIRSGETRDVALSFSVVPASRDARPDKASPP